MNKYVILLFAFALTATSAYAQTSAGNMMVGGSFQITSSSRQGGSANDFSSFTFAPSFGYFVSDNLVVGAELALENERTGTGNAKTIYNAFGFGPFARYYMFTSNDRFAFFGQAGVGFGTGKTDPAFGEVTRSNYINFSIAPGAAYFFNNHWALELSIPGLRISSRDPNTEADDDKVTTVEFSIRSLSPALGLRYHF